MLSGSYSCFSKFQSISIRFIPTGLFNRERFTAPSDRIYSESDEGKPTLLISLDLSSAFDVIDHAILLKWLSHSYRHRLFLDSVLPLWQNGVCLHRQTLISFDSMFCWRSARLCPWTTIIFDLHITFTIAHRHTISNNSNTLMTRNSMSLCHLLATATMSTLFSSTWLPFTHGFAKMGWSSTHPNQLPSSSARLSMSSLYPVLYDYRPTCKRSRLPALSDRVKILGATRL